jgi:hypothetical protein
LGRFLTTTSKNKELYCEDGFFHRKKRKNKQSYIWVCVTANCAGNISSGLNYTENINSFVRINGHNHELNTDKMIKIKIIDGMKRLIEAEFYSPREVVNLSLRGADLETIRILGNQQSLLRLLRRHQIAMLKSKPLRIYAFKIKS